MSKKTNARFEMAEEQKLPCSFTGFSLARNKDGDIIQDQHEYLKKLERLPLTASFLQFRSMRMKSAWLANTRPDCLSEIAQLAVTEEMFSQNPKQVLQRLKIAVAFAIDNRISLHIPKLNKDTLSIIGFTDSSLKDLAKFANNGDLSTQLGYVCFIGDDTGAVVPISFKSYKSRRVTRSAMDSEVIAFSDLFDVAGVLAAELEGMLGYKVPVQLLTDK